MAKFYSYFLQNRIFCENNRDGNAKKCPYSPRTFDISYKNVEHYIFTIAS